MVTDFVSSVEFRTDQVMAFYGGGAVGVIFAPNILKRPAIPTPAEVAGWADSALDLRTIEIMILSSAEFGANG